LFSRRLFLALTGGAIAAPANSWGASTVPDVPVALDHILLGCSDLDTGVSFVEQRTGVRASFGGVHPGRGTRNALLSLGNRHYLEIIAPDPAQPDAPDSFGLRKLSAPRLVTWAAHPGNLDEFASRLRGANLEFDGPTSGSRKRPDGKLLQWKTLNLKDNLGGLLPFLIEWNVGTTHPSVDAPSGCKIVRFSYAGPDYDGVGRILEILGLDVLSEASEKSQIRAAIAGKNGQMFEVTSEFWPSANSLNPRQPLA
jgi:hypothetical protein